MASACFSSYPHSIPEPLWKKPCLALAFLTRDSHGRTRSSVPAGSRRALSVRVRGWRRVIWTQALTFQALGLLICQQKWWLIPPCLDLTSEVTSSERPFLPGQSDKPPNTAAAWLSPLPVPGLILFIHFHHLIWYYQGFVYVCHSLDCEHLQVVDGNSAQVAFPLCPLCLTHRGIQWLVTEQVEDLLPSRLLLTK